MVQRLATDSFCASDGTRQGSPALLPADTELKRTVDRLLPRTGLAVVVYFAGTIAALNLASLLHGTEQLALEGAAVFTAGGWCGLNFWRCRHAHCVVTGAGWLMLSLLAFIGAGLGHSVIGGNERGIFFAVLVVGFAFEGLVRLLAGTKVWARRITGKTPDRTEPRG